jgi:hypothetical protein
MKKQVKKLKLTKETLENLAADTLLEIQGGMLRSDWDCSIRVCP